MYFIEHNEWRMIFHPQSTCSDSSVFDDEQLLDNVESAQMFVTEIVCCAQGGCYNYLSFLLAILLSASKIEALDDMFVHRIQV